MRKAPKRMLIELPTADEIDSLAITTPRFEVRKFEYELGGKKADLQYAPCKGQIVLVIIGKKGTVLAKRRSTKEWTLPTGRIGAAEDVLQAARRVAKEECGLVLRSLELAGMYDVVWHYAGISVKRLHIVYAAVTDDDECRPESPVECVSPAFHREVPDAALRNEITKSAIADCSGK